MIYNVFSELERAVRVIADYYKYLRHHEVSSNITLHDVYKGRHIVVIQRRKQEIL